MRRDNEERFRAFVSATADVIYQMSPDWSEMRHLEGRNFIPDTADPSRSWLEKYIHPDDQALVMAAIQEAIRTKSAFSSSTACDGWTAPSAGLSRAPFR